MAHPADAVQLHVQDAPRGFDATFAGGVPDRATARLRQTVLVDRVGSGPVPGKLSFRAGNTMRFRSGAVLAPGEYKVVIRGTPPGIVSKPSGGAAAQELDGETTPAWPTGDEVPGGDLEFKFTV